ncbi:DNA internalization-related competence protein ComEC/Rec2 [Rhodococcus chondri]|uniref:DNA internalization-related competence protein ComEC/Rec2 n=1 Tax=Rhodococcus chondri TaxID=3065941 RepID=A0ABU7JT15_9NOCA|nr:DNA internalization-related competence protein ComEC/Rec2 [Rhodococcus sp. CC-R104]MEE2033054.1 DNA internalization-related competence protein ComEC/Rec2 [Rhodococcus sp. CC-R104]
MTDPGRQGDAEPRRVDARLVPCAAAAWAATAAGLHGGPPVAVPVTVVALAAAAVVFAGGMRGPVRGHTGGRILLATLVVAAGFGGAIAVRMDFAEAHPLADAGMRGSWITAEIEPIDDPKMMRRNAFGGDMQVWFPADLHHVRIGTRSMATGGAVVVFAPAEGWANVLPGQRLTIRGRAAELPGAGTAVAAIRADGAPRHAESAPAVQRWAGSVRDRLTTAAARTLTPAQAGLLPGLVVGDTSEVPDDVREDFRVAGLTHLTAVSGANVSIVLGAVLLLVRAFGIGPRTGTCVAAVALVLFVVVVRPSPSVLRAAAMGAVGLLALVTGRERQALPALSASVGLLLLLWPDLAVDAAFALSVAATAGLILITPGWVARLRKRGWPRPVAEVCAVAAAAYLVTAPIVAAVTGTVSFVAIAANILVTPVLAPLTVLGSLVAVCATVAPVAGEVLAGSAAPMLWWLLTVADHAASVPDAEASVAGGLPGAATVIAIALGSGAVLRHRRLRAATVVALLAAVAVWLPIRIWNPGWPAAGWVFVACDVGQGDAVVLATGDGRAVVVDAGVESEPVDRCLRRLRIDHVAMLMISHMHADHVGGARGVLAGRTVDTVMTGPGATDREGGAALLATAAEFAVPVRQTRAGEVIRVGTLTLRVLAPTDENALPGAVSENDHSLVVAAGTVVGTILLTGDAEADAQDRLLRNGIDVRADVLKVPHHGSRTSSARFLAAVRPRVAVVSAGSGNPFGHPHPEIVGALTDLGTQILQTDVHGDIAVVRAGSGALAVVSDTRGTIDP